MVNQNSQHSSPRSPGIRCEAIKNICKLCTHIFEGGHRCASPALRGEPYCYHHQPARIGLPTRNAVKAAERHRRRTFTVPRPATRSELLQALGMILQALALNRLSPSRAGRLLAALQPLSNDLPPNSTSPSSAPSQSARSFPSSP